MQKFTRNTYEFVKQGLLQIQDEITKGERVCATRALKGIIGTMAPNREALLGYAYVRVRNRVGSKYGNTNRRAEIIAEKVQILMEAFWSRPTHYILDTDQYGAKFINTSSEADMSLEDAVRFAEMDGIVMIHDLNLGKGFEQYYLGTARNREILTHYAMSEENTSRSEVFRRKAYAKFQMWWMFTHGITLKELSGAAEDWRQQRKQSKNYKGKFEDYLFEKGFHDLIYPCFSEFLETEYTDREFMKYLLDPQDHSVYEEDELLRASEQQTETAKEEERNVSF